MTFWNAITTAVPSASPAGRATADARPAIGVVTRHATATARSVRTFVMPIARVDTSPERTPIQCNTPKASVMANAMAVFAGSREGQNSADSAPSPIDAAAIAAALEIQSVQPMTKPAYSPMARRANTYCPPDCGSIAASSATVMAPQREYSAPMIQTPRNHTGEGRAAATSPGVRRMPTPMVLATIIVAPKSTPRIFNSPVPDDLGAGETCSGCGGAEIGEVTRTTYGASVAPNRNRLVSRPHHGRETVGPRDSPRTGRSARVDAQGRRAQQDVQLRAFRRWHPFRGRGGGDRGPDESPSGHRHPLHAGDVLAVVTRRRRHHAAGPRSGARDRDGCVRETRGANLARPWRLQALEEILNDWPRLGDARGKREQLVIRCAALLKMFVHGLL